MNQLKKNRRGVSKEGTRKKCSRRVGLKASHRAVNLMRKHGPSQEQQRWRWLKRTLERAGKNKGHRCRGGGTGGKAHVTLDAACNVHYLLENREPHKSSISLCGASIMFPELSKSKFPCPKLLLLGNLRRPLL